MSEDSPQRRYWFARYGNGRSEKFDLYYEIASWSWLPARLIVRPVAVEGWVVLWSVILGMIVGGVLAVIFARNAIERGWGGLAYGGWAIICIAVAGLVMNMRIDPNKSAEEYLLEQCVPNRDRRL